MNLFNRVVMIILLFALLVAAFFSLIAPSAVFGWLQGGLAGLEERILPANLLSGAFWAYLGTALGAMLLSSVLLWLELRPPRRKTVEMSDTEGRTVLVSVKSITQRLQSTLSAVHDVGRVKPQVLSRGKKVDVHLDLQVHPAVDLPFKTDEITQLTREVIQEGMGVKVGKVRVNMRYGPEGPRTEPELSPLAEPAEPTLPEPVVKPAPVTPAGPEYLLEDSGGELRGPDAAISEPEHTEEEPAANPEEWAPLPVTTEPEIVESEDIIGESSADLEE